MKIIIAEATSGSSSPATLFHIVVQRWQKQIARLLDPYRPELHYMRGPGPKWREKHGLLNAHADSASAVAGFATSTEVSVAFLCSAMADQITGTAIAVDGAWMAQ